MARLRILVLCTGNTCRSPMAAVLLKQALQDELGEKAAYIEVVSAGLRAVPGSFASPQAVIVMREIGLGLSGHRACQATRELVRSADLVLTMTRYQKQHVLEVEPAAQGKTWSFGEMAALSGTREVPFGDIDDPFGQSAEVYRQVRDQLKVFLGPIVQYIKQMVLAEG